MEVKTVLRKRISQYASLDCSWVSNDSGYQTTTKEEHGQTSEYTQDSYDNEPASVNNQCLSCKLPLIWCQQHSGFTLVTYNEVPEYMQSNPYIIEGYRPLLPVGLAVRSLFTWSNETLNIWSHLIGLTYFFGCFVYDNTILLPRWHAKFEDHVIVSVGLICFMVCMLMSAAFHWFFVISERASRIWFIMDMMGISVGLMGIYITGIYYCFYCYHEIHNAYLTIFCVLAFTTLALPLIPDYANPAYKTLRNTLYICVAAYGVIPSIHFLILHDWHHPFTMYVLPNILIVYTISVLALITYLTMVPERFLPGKFDYFGQSHNWWHLLVMICLVWWRWSGLDILYYRLTNSCS